MKKDDQGQVDTKRNTQLQHYKQKKKLRFLQRKLPGISRRDEPSRLNHGMQLGWRYPQIFQVPPNMKVPPLKMLRPVPPIFGPPYFLQIR